MRKWEEWNLGQKIAAIAAGLVGGIALIFVFGLVVMLLWNWLMPRIFGLPAIGYWEGWGLVLLSAILFKGSPRGGNPSERKRKHMIKARMREECPGGETTQESEERS